MVRDWKAEKKIRMVSWLTWKLSAILLVLMGIGLLGISIYAYFTGRNLGKMPLPPLGMAGIGALYALMGLGYWKVGKSLDRLRPWARRLTVGLYVLQIAMVVFYVGALAFVLLKGGKNLNPTPQKLAPMIGMLLFYSLLLILYIYLIKVLLDRRAKKIFSKDYQYRLKHNIFDKIKVGADESAGSSGLATAAYAFVGLMIVVAVIGILAAIAIPNLLSSRKATNETVTIAALRGLYSGQIQYKISKKEVDTQGIAVYAKSFTALRKSGLFDLPPSNVKYGYRFEMRRTNGGQGFQVTAVPTKRGSTGDRSFYVDESGTLTYTIDGKIPNAKSPSIGG